MGGPVRVWCRAKERRGEWNYMRVHDGCGNVFCGS